MTFLFKSAATPAETLRIRRVLVIGVGLAGFLVGGAGVASVAVVLALVTARVPRRGRRRAGMPDSLPTQG